MSEPNNDGLEDFIAFLGDQRGSFVETARQYAQELLAARAEIKRLSALARPAEWVDWHIGACHHLDDEAFYYIYIADRVTGEPRYLWMQPCHWSSYTRAYWSSPLPPPYAPKEKP